MAASIVVLWHTDEFTHLFGLEGYGFGATGMAGAAVVMFFVLSGFLITLLLLKELEKTQTISIKEFYLRRIFRIWPVYYLALTFPIFFSTLIDQQRFTGHHPLLSGFLYVFFMPNVAYAFGQGVFSILPLWSVGVEEQFYAIWPWLVRRSRHLLRTLATVILAFLMVKIGLRFLENGLFYELIRLTLIDSMAVGGIFAWLVHHNHRWLNYVFSWPVQMVCWLHLAVSIVWKPIYFISLFDSELYSVLFGCIIVNVSCNPNSLFKLENRVANFIGQVSYGLYAYHVPVICLLHQPLRQLLQPYQNQPWAPLVVLLSVYGTATLVASLSYRYWETPFLRRKRKRAVVESSDRAE